MTIATLLSIIAIILVFVIFLIVYDFAKRVKAAYGHLQQLFDEMSQAMNNLQLEKKYSKIKEELKADPENSLPGYAGLDNLAEGESLVVENKIEEYFTSGNEALTPASDPVSEEPEPEPTLETIKGKTIVVSFDEGILFPVLDKDELPVNMKLPLPVVKVIKQVFNLTDDHRQLLTYEEVKQFLKAHAITPKVNYPKNETGNKITSNFPISTYIKKKVTPEEERQYRNEAMVKTIENSSNLLKVIRFQENGKIVSKECGNIELYKNFIRKFGGTIFADVDKFPTRDAVEEWLKEAIAEYSELRDVE